MDREPKATYCLQLRHPKSLRVVLGPARDSPLRSTPSEAIVPEPSFHAVDLRSRHHDFLVFLLARSLPPPPPPPPPARPPTLRSRRYLTSRRRVVETTTAATTRRSPPTTSTTAALVAKAASLISFVRETIVSPCPCRFGHLSLSFIQDSAPEVSGLLRILLSLSHM